MSRIKALFLALALLPFFSLAPVLAAASTNPLDAACQSNDKANSGALCKQSQTQGDNNPVTGTGGVINQASTIIALFTGIAAVIMIILGAISYATSGGNSDATKKARDRITSALIGLVVIALAWALVRFITDRVIG